MATHPDDDDTMGEEQVRRIQEALDALTESVRAERPTHGSGHLTASLVTMATRQALLAMAQALEPADTGEGLDTLRAEVAGKAWRALQHLGPLFMLTLPPKFHYD